MPQVDYPRIVADSKSAYHLFTIWVDEDRRDEILEKLGANEIGVAVNYRAIHLLTYFRKTFGCERGDFSIAEKIGDRTLSLPFYVGLKPEEIRHVGSVLKDIR